MVNRPWKVKAREVHDEILASELSTALFETDGNISRAAERLGLTRQHVTRLVKQHNLGDYAAKLRFDAGGVRVRIGSLAGHVLGRPRTRKKRR